MRNENLHTYWAFYGGSGLVMGMLKKKKSQQHKRTVKIKHPITKSEKNSKCKYLTHKHTYAFLRMRSISCIFLGQSKNACTTEYVFYIQYVWSEKGFFRL